MRLCTLPFGAVQERSWTTTLKWGGTSWQGRQLNSLMGHAECVTYRKSLRGEIFFLGLLLYCFGCAAKKSQMSCDAGTIYLVGQL